MRAIIVVNESKLLIYSWKTISVDNVATTPTEINHKSQQPVFIQT